MWMAGGRALNFKCVVQVGFPEVRLSQHLKEKQDMRTTERRELREKIQ